MFRVIIAGSRKFGDYALLKKTMDSVLTNVQDDIAVVCGKARGTDTLGEQYAKERGYAVQYFPADWNRYGKVAGYIRNTTMAKNADALVAFWDGQSPGTRHMIQTAQSLGLKTRVKTYGTKREEKTKNRRGTPGPIDHGMEVGYCISLNLIDWSAVEDVQNQYSYWS